jgi:hypothetical protein
LMMVSAGLRPIATATRSGPSSAQDFNFPIA